MENKHMKIVIIGEKYNECLYPYDFIKLEKDFIKLSRGTQMNKSIKLTLGKTSEDIKNIFEIRGHYMIIYNDIFENKDYYPLNIKELREMVNRLVLNYERLGYESIIKLE